MTEKELIKEYVDDHYKYFDYYPIDVEVNGKIYDFKTYEKFFEKQGIYVDQNKRLKIIIRKHS